MQIEFKNLFFNYNNKSKFKVTVLKNINHTINKNNTTAIVGKTGSGKSTLTELINYFLKPTSGEVKVNEFINSNEVKNKYKKINELRKHIGYLFQFSENQLFEDTVIKDVSFGIKNFYPKNVDIETKAKEALKLVGLDGSFYNRSPFDLSGGEKKRVAIAGVIAYKPDLLILDEPTAGLDVKGKKDIMDLFKKIHETGVQIILISHDMNVVLDYADEMIILDDGEIKRVGSPKEILKENVEQYNLETPYIYKTINALKSHGINLENITDITSLVKELKNRG